MKPGYKISRSIPEKHHQCIVVWNYKKYNQYTEVPLSLEKVGRLHSKTEDVGVWIPKGTKRPHNWPNQNKLN